MTNNGTGLAVKMMIVFAVTALFLFYIAGTQRHIREPDMGWVLGAILLLSVLLMQIFFFKFPENRRPIGFFLVFIGLIILPGCAFLITQVVFDLQFKAQWGIDFYNFRYETVYGVQVENGLPVPKLSYTYKFNINEMREPLQKLVVENGWTYKGVVVFAKWLTG